MVLQKILVALIGVFALLPLHAEQAVGADAVANEAGQDPSGSAQVPYTRGYAEPADQVVRQPVAPDSTSVDPAIAQREKALKQRYEAARASHQQRIETIRRQQRERAAQMKKWREARLEAHLKQRETRQQQIIQRHEAMRNRAEEEHNFLVKHHEEMLEQVLQSKIDIANRHENMRKQADERRKKFAAFRTTMKDMSAQERHAYMEEHREELFGSAGAARQRGMPAPPRHRGMHRPSPPPWVRPAPAR